MKKKKKPVSVKQFIEKTGADTIIADIEQKLIAKNKEKTGKESLPAFSDLISTDAEGNVYQHVDYVQEGGGVLGVALVGYTYVLEKLGIRFTKLAGTSAGAINTIMLAAVDRKNYAKAEAEQGNPFTTQSEVILYELLRYNLWDFVDGSKFGKILIATAIKAASSLKWLFKRILLFLALTIVTAFAIGLLYTFKIGLDKPWIQNISEALFIVAFACSLAIIIVALVTFIYMYRFDKSGFGINPGKSFHKWITEILQRNGIRTTDELNAKMHERCCNLQLRPERLAKNIPGDSATIGPPFLTIVASDITNQTKVEFPLMAGEYWQHAGQTSPADYVRASMSIPIFFEPFTVCVPDNLHQPTETTALKTLAAAPKTGTGKTVQFVDGGILSNFPINVFHNPKIEWARMPTMGVKLEDEKHETAVQNLTKPKRKFLPFVGSIFSTIRFYYDRDFLKKNAVYEACIAHVDVEKFNWLDFGIDEATKKKLFIQGVLAARTFFLGSEVGGNFWVDGKEMPFEAFDWESFKQARRNVLIRG